MDVCEATVACSSLFSAGLRPTTRGVDFTETNTRMEPLITLWGFATVMALLVNAFVTLGPIAAEAFDMPLGAHHVAFLVGWCAFMLFFEGYRGFQRSFSPRVVARAFWLGREARPLDILLAPAFCMGLYRAPRRIWVTAWSVLIGVVLLVILVGELAQPWRGLVDIGVLAGLGWGAISMLALLVNGFAHPARRFEGAHVVG